MKRHHAITTAVVFVILGLLVYFQVRHWRTFNWHEFWLLTSGINKWSVLAGIGLIYFVYYLRAIRWMIFLKPSHDTTVKRLIAPQVIGFTGLALLGRPGELVRPFLIARRENVTFSSQLAVWAVERVFDVAAVAVLLGVNLALKGSKYRAVPQVAELGFAMLGIAAMLSISVFLLWWRTEFICVTLGRLISKFSHKMAASVTVKVKSFGEGLHTIKDLRSFLSIVALSMVIWLAVAQAYIQVLHAYPEMKVTVTRVDSDGNPLPPVMRTVRLHKMHLEDVVLVMGSSMVGSVVQLPGVGGGSQLAVIGILSSEIFRGEPYNITPELATSCGIMLWLVTFMSVIPAGLILAHRERISLRELSAESETEAEEEKKEESSAL